MIFLLPRGKSRENLLTCNRSCTSQVWSLPSRMCPQGMTRGRRDERSERPERETRERGRGEGVTSEDLRSLRHEVEAGKEELQELKQKVERSSRLTLQAAKDSGEQRAQLQLVFFALGALRVALEEVLTAYNSGQAQVREGGAKGPPLKNLLYTKLVGHVHERANQNHSSTELQKVAQELYNHSPEFEIHSVTNATKQRALIVRGCWC